MAPLMSRFALAAALSGSLGLLSLDAPASAAGFTGEFANWTLTNYADYEPGDPFAAAPVGTYSVSTPKSPYACDDPFFSVTCINDFDAGTGTATLVGSNSDADAALIDPGYSNGNPGQSWATQWEMSSAYAGSPAPYDLTFDWAFVPGDLSSDDQSYYYTVDASNNVTTFLLGSGSGSGSKTVTLNTGWKLGFGVYTVSNAGGPGNLAITNFNQPVPAPLPLLGAGAAFGWSRRLRRRLRTATAVQPR